jgi:hypothetical protein
VKHRGVITLERGDDRTPVPASVVEQLTPEEIADAEDEWFPYLLSALQTRIQQGIPRRDLPEHKHWVWEDKARLYYAQSTYLFLGILCASKLEGLMLINRARACRLPRQKGLPLVYVDYIATAPWNIASLADTPRYRGVGRALIQCATDFSADNGWQGRIGLHSLPQSETFYRDVCGLTDLGVDVNGQGLHYYERSVT